MNTLNIHNKSQTGFIYIIIMFAVLAMITMFSMIFIYEIGSDPILGIILNVTLEIEQTLNVSQQLQDHAQDVKDSYDAIDIPYDLFFLYLWVSSIAASIALALAARKKSIFSLMGGMFFTLMGVMLIVFFIDQFQVWFFANIFDPVFADITLNLPIFDYYFANFGWITGIWFMLLLFIQQVDLDIKLGGRVQE